jgi:hypothetical protein
MYLLVLGNLKLEFTTKSTVPLPLPVFKVAILTLNYEREVNIQP